MSPYLLFHWLFVARTKTVLFVVLGLLAVFASSSAYAQNQNNTGCTANPDVPVNVTPLFGTPSYNFNTGLAELQNLSRDAYHVIPESLTLGLTHYMPVLEIRPMGIAKDLPDGTTCFHVEKVDITFGYKDVTVYVAKEIPEQSCGFNEILAHEQKHVAVQQKIFDDYIPLLQQKVKTYLAENGTRQSSDYADASNWLYNNLQSLIADIMKDVFTENTRLQRDIDTLQEYERVSRSCNGQIGQILRSLPYAPR